MKLRSLVGLAGVVSSLSLAAERADACCPAPPSGKPVVNADQTVVIAWDAANKTEHFIRRAKWKSEAEDFGFLVPTPSKPELAESGDDAFPALAKITEPEIQRVRRSGEGCGCTRSASKSAASPPPQTEVASVTVLEEKTVAGFDAVVLEASSADALTGWLKDHGYAFSPEVQAWAKPYVDGGWKITALRVTKDPAQKSDRGVGAAALRMSFKTDRPLFPYREPDTTAAAPALGASSRLLRIFFLSDARYDGEVAKTAPWTGTVAWSNELSPEAKKRALDLLRIPATAAGPGNVWLTEFEDPWPYRVAPADLYFSRAAKQEKVKRPPIIEYYSANTPGSAGGMALTALATVLGVVLVRRRKS